MSDKVERLIARLVRVNNQITRLEPRFAPTDATFPGGPGSGNAQQRRQQYGSMDRDIAAAVKLQDLYSRRMWLEGRIAAQQAREAS